MPAAVGIAMFARPGSNLVQFDIYPGAHVADLGAGSGFYALAAGRMAGPRGKVFAIDVQQELLDRIKKEADHEGLRNIEVIWGDIEQPGGTRLRDGSVDRVILSDVLSQADDRGGALSESFRILKSGGRLLIVDWSDTSDLSGPDAAHLIRRETALKLAESRGFSYELDVSAGAHHWGLIFKKAITR